MHKSTINERSRGLLHLTLNIFDVQVFISIILYLVPDTFNLKIEKPIWHSLFLLSHWLEFSDLKGLQCHLCGVKYAEFTVLQRHFEQRYVLVRRKCIYYIIYYIITCSLPTCNTWVLFYHWHSYQPMITHYFPIPPWSNILVHHLCSNSPNLLPIISIFLSSL